jgi:hypothetical protein
VVDENHPGWRILCFDAKATPAVVGSSMRPFGGVPLCRWSDLADNGIAVPQVVENDLKAALPDG